MPVSYGFVFLMTMLEFLGLPAPGGILVAIVGAALPEGNMRLIPLICVAALGAAAGDTPWYFRLTPKVSQARWGRKMCSRRYLPVTPYPTSEKEDRDRLTHWLS
jgi:membrane protein DedA with SNARE-associated domain